MSSSFKVARLADARSVLFRWVLGPIARRFGIARVILPREGAGLWIATRWGAFRVWRR